MVLEVCPLPLGVDKPTLLVFLLVITVVCVEVLSAHFATPRYLPVAQLALSMSLCTGKVPSRAHVQSSQSVPGLTLATRSRQLPGESRVIAIPRPQTCALPEAGSVWAFFSA